VSRPPFEVSHLIFDIDGTLIDYVAAIRAGLEAVAGHIEERTGGAEVRVEELWALRNEVAADPVWRTRTIQEIRRESFRRVLAAFDGLERSSVDEVQELYYRVRNDAMTVFPEVEAALGALQARGLTLTAASNGNFSLSRVGLDGYFANTQYAEQLGVSKPDPGFFALAAERGGAPVGETLAVGDRIDNDYEPARAAGLHAVLVDRHDRVEDAEVVRVRALNELERLLAQP
jgi:putative hydrolase of the HAD superfamily